MKLLQQGYNEIQAVEIELRILEQTSAPPSRPRKYSTHSRAINKVLTTIPFYTKIQQNLLSHINVIYF